MASDRKKKYEIKMWRMFGVEGVDRRMMFPMVHNLVAVTWLGTNLFVANFSGNSSRYGGFWFGCCCCFHVPVLILFTFNLKIFISFGFFVALYYSHKMRMRILFLCREINRSEAVDSIVCMHSLCVSVCATDLICPQTWNCDGNEW